MSRWYILLAVLIFRGSASLATELNPLVKAEKLGIILKQMDYPKTMAKDLLSGLSNRLLMRIELIRDTKVVSQRIVEVSVKYDLWDENFKTQLSTDSGETFSKTFPTLETTLSFLGDLKVLNLWPAAELTPNSSFQINVDALLNPLQKEQMQTIRKWVMQNSTFTPTDAGGIGRALPNSPSSANTLFNKIFEQYAQQGDVAAGWHGAVASRAFRHNEVPREK